VSCCRPDTPIILQLYSSDGVTAKEVSHFTQYVGGGEIDLDNSFSGVDELELCRGLFLSRELDNVTGAVWISRKRLE
jgi:hypothetical protein